MQFKVPQFLEIEDKIFGPFTFKQFAYMAGGGGMCFVVYRAMGLFWGAIPILAIGGLSLALTFYKPNNRPFVDILQSGIKYFSQSKLYIWKKRPVDTKIQTERMRQMSKEEIKIFTPRLSESKLKDLAWSLDVLDLKK